MFFSDFANVLLRPFFFTEPPNHSSNALQHHNETQGPTKGVKARLSPDWPDTASMDFPDKLNEGKQETHQSSKPGVYFISETNTI